MSPTVNSDDSRPLIPEHAVPFFDRPWVWLPDCPPCPVCGSPHTRWDAISPDYFGDWWECEHDHRFLLSYDGDAYPCPPAVSAPGREVR
jgi:hypothetical protein